MNQPTITKATSWQMFNDISPRYDLLNRVLSFGLDISWRKKLAKFAVRTANSTILDLATGTADVLLTICHNNPNITKAYGVDLAEKMLEVGRQKIIHKSLQDKITLVHGDATKIPFPNNSFDVTTMSFGIRNVPEHQKVMKEMYRVLKPGGRTLILEFSLPTNPIIRFFHLFYLRTMVPLIGGLLTGHYAAYKYLNKTIESFPYGDEFAGQLKSNGFNQVKIYSLMCGAASIYIGEKK